MGADTTSTQLIFFIAATLVAVSASAILSGIVIDLSGKMDAKGAEIGEQLTTDIKIANDPGSVPNNPVLIYVKNTGQTTLNATLTTLLVDGSVVTTTKSIVGAAAGTTEWRTGDVLKLTYTATLASGDHQVRVLTQNGVHDDMKFRV